MQNFGIGHVINQIYGPLKDLQLRLLKILRALPRDIA